MTKLGPPFQDTLPTPQSLFVVLCKEGVEMCSRAGLSTLGGNLAALQLLAFVFAAEAWSSAHT